MLKMLRCLGFINNSAGKELATAENAQSLSFTLQQVRRRITAGGTVTWLSLMSNTLKTLLIKCS